MTNLARTAAMQCKGKERMVWSRHQTQGKRVQSVFKTPSGGHSRLCRPPHARTHARTRLHMHGWGCRKTKTNRSSGLVVETFDERGCYPIVRKPVRVAFIRHEHAGRSTSSNAVEASVAVHRPIGERVRVPFSKRGAMAMTLCVCSMSASRMVAHVQCCALTVFGSDDRSNVGQLQTGCYGSEWWKRRTSTFQLLMA